MNSMIRYYVLFLILGAVIGTVLFIIPFVGPLLFLPLIPLAELYDFIIPGDFGETGNHVEVGFAWITFKTIEAWIFYISFFFFVGLIVGVLKHATKKKHMLFAIGLFVLFCVTTALQMLINEYTYNQELIEFTTPSETVFVCDTYSSLELEDDGSLWKFQQDGSIRSSSLVGNVDFNSNTFSFHELLRGKNEYAEELITEYIKDLDSCRDINGDAIRDIYSIESF